MPGTDITTGSLPAPDPPGSGTHRPLRGWVQSDDYHGPDRREGGGMAALGIEGRAKSLSNIAAVAIIASIAVTLITVVVTVMWSALKEASSKSEALVQAIQTQTDASRKREDMLRELWMRDNAQQRETIAAMTAATNASTQGMQAKLDAMVLTIAAEEEKKRQVMEQVLEQLKILNKTAAKKGGPP